MFVSESFLSSCELFGIGTVESIFRAGAAGEWGANHAAFPPNEEMEFPQFLCSLGKFSALLWEKTHVGGALFLGCGSISH